MNLRHPLLAVINTALNSANSLKATAVTLALLPAIGSADDQQAAIDALIDGLHQDAHEGNFQTYFDRYTPDAVFLGTDKSERWTIEEFKVYAEPAFEDGHGWTYSVKERNWEGDGTTRWFDEVLLNEKLVAGTGVVTDRWRVENRALRTECWSQ